MLALVTVGGVAGGYVFGKKQWEKAPKDFVSAATLNFHVRPPFAARGVGVQQAIVGGVANLNEAEVMRELRSDTVLAPIVTKMSLSQKWEMGADEAMDVLRSSIELDLNKEKQELYVILTRPNPVESAEIANALAEKVPVVIKALDDQAKAEGGKKVKVELEPFIEGEVVAKAKLKSALAAKGVEIELYPGVDLDAYSLIPEVLSARVEWDSAREVLESTKLGQGEYSSYWGRAVKPTFVSQEATPPPRFVGPDVKPFQVQWGLYGLTAGLVVGSLLTLLCWKLFP